MNVLLVGAPGSGKRTQAWFLERDQCLCNISMSGLFRTTLIKYNEHHHHQRDKNKKKDGDEPRDGAIQQESGLPAPGGVQTEAPSTALKKRTPDDLINQPLTPHEIALVEAIKNGRKIRDEDCVQIIADYATSARCSKGYVIHGFPRTAQQAKLVWFGDDVIVYVHSFLVVSCLRNWKGDMLQSRNWFILMFHLTKPMMC
eukprot:TRINITY_DN8858_c0_g1_i2.p1 TRINITY_DN8858_c0_g1~~TRINITY_DN8858_c0_g1_i2.p1  ORF type:complete len:200 (-),score=50.93 TRINITY_DN8858_c0_g1_i2:219-818(-)